MSNTTITVEVTLQPDGLTLQLEKKIAMPPGRVTLIVQPKGPQSGPTILEVLDRIHRDQQQRGQKPITEEAMVAEIAELRAEDDQYEKRWQEIWSQESQKPMRTCTSGG